jgi:uncharacterized protein (TIGR02118 family)
MSGAMIVRFTQWQPRDGLDPKRALLAWERHVAIVERVPSLRRYVQNHVVEAPDGSEPQYSGIGEAWFEDFRAARSALESPEGSGDRGRAHVHGFRLDRRRLGRTAGRSRPVAPSFEISSGRSRGVRASRAHPPSQLRLPQRRRFFDPRGPGVSSCLKPSSERSARKGRARHPARFSLRP